LEADEVKDDAFVVTIACMGAPTMLSEKGIGSEEYAVLTDMISRYYNKKIDALMPIEVGA
jgi:DUF917 family protein